MKAFPKNSELVKCSAHMINDLMPDDKIKHFLIKFHFKSKESTVSELEEKKA